MPIQTSPFIEAKYGWAFGESGWNSGMDENLLKFSFMFDGNIDGVVSSLPTAVNGAAYFLTTDNRLYFAANSTWYSTVTPKWFQMKIRSSGDVYQFNGTTAVQIDSPAGVEARLDAVELTVSTLGTAAFEDVDFFATQAELDVAEAEAADYTDTLRSDLSNNTGLGGTDNIGFDGSTSAAVFVGAKLLTNYTALRAYTGVATGIRLTDKWIAGIFQYDSTDTTSADNGATIIVDASARRWKRMFDQEVNILWWGADPTGVVDSSAAFTSAWQFIAATLENPYTNTFIVYSSLKIPQGKYLINTSINWTNLQAWNIQVNADGAVLVGKCAGKAVIDATGVRGLHLKGMTILGDNVSTPSTGLLVGPILTNTCGNNKFSELKTSGFFTTAAVANLGSETTDWDYCYFQNNQSGTAAYAYAGDGDHTLGLTSDYATLRSATTAVSFSNNHFYSCRFANYSGGYGTYLSAAFGWEFDHGCYHLAFDNANFLLRQKSTNVARMFGLKISGLFETTQAPGVDYHVHVMVDNGLSTDIKGFELDVGQANCGVAVIRLTNESGVDMTSGSMKLVNARIKVGSFNTSLSGIVLFDGANLYLQGLLDVRNASMINLLELTAFQGIIYTDNANNITFPTSGAFSYSIYDENSLSGQVIKMAGNSGNYVGFQAGTAPLIRADGSSTDIDLRLQGKGAGLVRFGTFTSTSDTAINGYFQMKMADGTIKKVPTIP